MTESLFGCLEISFIKEMSLLLQNLTSGNFSGCGYEGSSHVIWQCATGMASSPGATVVSL